MKCTNKKKIYHYQVYTRMTAMVLIVAVSLMLCGCGNAKYSMPYQIDSEVSGYNVISFDSNDKAIPFAEDLCVVVGDVEGSAELDITQATSAVLFDVNNKEVMYSKNAHERLYPASITKVMTALVALKYASGEQVLTASENVKITEPGAQLCGLKPGDTMTMEQALHILLMYSANDVAIMIAENVGGSVEGFLEMMNEEARRLGATNTNFTNPHGLTEESHYTTAYDLYLIFNEAIKYETFNQIIHTSEYQTTFYDKNGKSKEIKFSSTNRFINGKTEVPSDVTVVGGKTGTTDAAGHCLILLSKDTSGAQYITVILRSTTSDDLYAEMSDLLEEINK